MYARSHVVVGVVVCGLLSLARPAHAEEFPEDAVYVAVHAGPLLTPGPWDFHATDTTLLPEPGVYFHGGAKVGWQANGRCALEGGVFAVAHQSTEHVNNFALEGDVDALYHLNPDDITPYVLLGAGVYGNLVGDLGLDVDPTVKVGFGLRTMIAPGAALRLEARYVGTDGFTAIGASNIELRMGVDLWPGHMRSTDADGDGISDTEDACPQVAGSATAAGCPDADGDGVVDREDVCIDEPGTAAAKGCPDGDGDGVPDSEDTCPTVAGAASAAGCPDADGDGVADSEDTCPDVPGLAALAGCPDGDGDGILDAEDACPTEPGTKAAGGCPDGDRDGVADKDDKCPDVRGLKKHDGCVPDEVKEFTGAIKGITFESGSASIRPASFRTLDRAVAVLTRFDGLRLRVEGHTDDQGDDASNLKLSEDRAAAVVAYLVGKGVDASRLEARGFGETKPVADNGTAAGRAENRRIEFAILEQ